MIAAIIRWSVANRFLVVLAAIALAMAGVFAMRATPVDALPDLSDTQVIRALAPNRLFGLMIPTFCGVRNKVGSCALGFPISSGPWT